MDLDFLAGKRCARSKSRLRTSLAAAGLLALAAALLPAASPAAETPPPSLDEMDLEQLMDLKVDTVYGASLYAQTTSEAPSSVTIITSEQIKRFGWRTLAEILAAVRSFYLTDDRVYTYLGVRGLQRPGDYNSRVLVLLDGHTTNDNLYGGASFGHDAHRRRRAHRPGRDHPRPRLLALRDGRVLRRREHLHPDRQGDRRRRSSRPSAGSLETYEGRLSFGRRFGNGVDLVLSGSRYGSAGEARLLPPGVRRPRDERRRRRGRRRRGCRVSLPAALPGRLHARGRVLRPRADLAVARRTARSSTPIAPGARTPAPTWSCGTTARSPSTPISRPGSSTTPTGSAATTATTTPRRAKSRCSRTTGTRGTAPGGGRSPTPWSSPAPTPSRAAPRSSATCGRTRRTSTSNPSVSYLEDERDSWNWGAVPPGAAAPRRRRCP